MMEIGCVRIFKLFLLGIFFSFFILDTFGALGDQEQFIRAVRKNQVQVVESYFKNLSQEEQIARANLRDDKKRPLLSLASHRGHEGVVKCLLQKGAEVDAQDLDGATPLYMAVSKGHAAVVTTLLEYQANPNLFDQKNISPLHLAVNNQDLSLTRALLGKGARVDTQQTTNQRTPVFLAAEKGDEKILKSLLEVDSNVLTITNHKGILPLVVALYKGHKRCALTLLKHGADPNSFDPDGISALQLAAYKGLQNVAAELITRGADLFYHSPEEVGGESVLDFAAQGGQFRIMEYFKEEQRKKESSSVEEEKQYLERDPLLRTFYRHYELKSIEIFGALKVLSSGIIERRRNHALDRLSGGVILLGEHVPIVGVGVSTLGLLVEQASDIREFNIYEHNSSLMRNFKTIDEESEKVARALTYRYENQIKRLTEQGAKDLTEAGISRMLEFLRDRLILGEDLGLEMMTAMGRYRTRVGILGLRNKSIGTRENLNWTDQGIFQETGLITKEGRRYRLKNSRVEKYGYRLSTETEIAFFRGQPEEDLREVVPLRNDTFLQGDTGSSSVPEVVFEPPEQVNKSQLSTMNRLDTRIKKKKCLGMGCVVL